MVKLAAHNIWQNNSVITRSSLYHR